MNLSKKESIDKLSKNETCPMCGEKVTGEEATATLGNEAGDIIIACYSKMLAAPVISISSRPDRSDIKTR